MKEHLWISRTPDTEGTLYKHRCAFSAAAHVFFGSRCRPPSSRPKPLSILPSSRFAFRTLSHRTIVSRLSRTCRRVHQTPPIFSASKVTDYPRSLALWAGTTDEARLADDETTRAGYWDSFRNAIRQAELHQQEELDAEVAADAEEAAADAAASAAGGGSAGIPAGGGILAARPLSECRSRARYGSGAGTVRMGREYSAAELMPIVPEVFGARGAVEADEL